MPSWIHTEEIGVTDLEAVVDTEMVPLAHESDVVPVHPLGGFQAHHPGALAHQQLDKALL